jgi:hypothetical protein
MKPAGEASFAHYYHLYKKNADYRNVSFELSKDQFRLLTKGNCFYCGAEPSMLHKRLISNGAYLCNGVDRVDNAIGYTAENSVPCCTDCNMMKKAMSAEKFVSACRRIVGHQSTRLEKSRRINEVISQEN